MNETGIIWTQTTWNAFAIGTRREPYRAITVQQGWASLFFIPDNPKNVENRTWQTDYRGPILIHAGKSKKSIPESRQFCMERYIEFPYDLPLGVILGVAELVHCGEVNSIWSQSDQIHWWFKNAVRLPQPIPCNGALKLWTPQPEIQTQVRQQLHSLESLPTGQLSLL